MVVICGTDLDGGMNEGWARGKEWRGERDGKMESCKVEIVVDGDLERGGGE